MLSFFRPASWSRDAVLEAYGRVVAQARQPDFYLGYEVEDTVEGRFDLILLHLVLVMRAARGRSGGAAFAQDLFDLFVRDMDRSLREMGVGDISIAKKMKRVGRAFYGRAERYEAALEARSVAALSDGLARNVYDRDTVTAPSRRLALYAFAAEDRLSAIPAENILGGEIVFPDPSEIDHD